MSGSLYFFYYILKLFVLELEEKIMDAILNKNKNRFETTMDLHNLINFLRIKIICISNVNYKDTIPTPMKEINNEV